MTIDTGNDVNYCEACQSEEHIDLGPFFQFYGSKWSLAMNYPSPRYDLIIEPFAGSAGYSTSYHRHNVVIVEKDPVIAGIWEYLISATPEEILSLPLLEQGQLVSDLGLSVNQSNLVGFWCAWSNKTPGRRLTKHASAWSEKVRRRLSKQVSHIKHWSIVCDEFDCIEDVLATWFIDPPYYDGTGDLYRMKRRYIDQNRLLDFCISRQGQTIVCEGGGASWLPFDVLYSSLSHVTMREHDQLVFCIDR